MEYHVYIKVECQSAEALERLQRVLDPRKRIEFEDEVPEQDLDWWRKTNDCELPTRLEVSHEGALLLSYELPNVEPEYFEHFSQLLSTLCGQVCLQWEGENDEDIELIFSNGKLMKERRV
ncbi:hypothetical protein EV696_1113 [Permianibacter aggregans]|uniref:Uncharacterized protein n=1 Tax=Permianibacter aggregans TaxID=1510150 RepID=A0A4R6ULM5_9GAMM|nr:hypothetical protein EV696_1113 [Permianibacter aggregans]